jgi:hypothetical protein
MYELHVRHTLTSYTHLRFNDFGCRSDKDVLPLIINSLEATVEVGDLGTKYNNRLKSVKCEIHEW